MKLKARDIMVTPVLTAKASSTVGEVAKLMTEKRISGLPIVEADGKLVGIVSETDLLHRAETGTDRRRKWWMRLLLDRDTLARDFVRTHSTRVGDIMSPYVVSVAPDAGLRHVADVLESAGIKRVPVMENGKLIGIITRGDLVRALAAQQPQAPDAADDAKLQRKVQERMAAQPWLNATYLTVAVSEGVIQVSGLVSSQTQHKALLVLLNEVGAKGVKDHVKVGGLALYAG